MKNSSIKSRVSRRHFIATAGPAHHSVIPGHLGPISMLTGRKLKWDVENEKILGEDEAAELLARPFRPPWKLA